MTEKEITHSSYFNLYFSRVLHRYPRKRWIQTTPKVFRTREKESMGFTSIEFFFFSYYRVPFRRLYENLNLDLISSKLEEV